MKMAPEVLQEFLAQNRREASQWARKVLADEAVVLLDTETTGLGPEAEIVDVAVTDRAGRPLLDSLVRPRGPIPPDATAVHGITATDVADAPTWDVVHGELADILNRASRIIIYNVDYDLRLLGQSSALYRLPKVGPPRRRYECAMKQYARFLGNWDDYHQSFTWPRLQGGNHRALGDCVATLAVLQEMASEGS